MGQDHTYIIQHNHENDAVAYVAAGTAMHVCPRTTYGTGLRMRDAPMLFLKHASAV